MKTQPGSILQSSKSHIVIVEMIFMPTIPEPFTPETAIGQRILIAFEGRDELPETLLAALREIRPAGVTLFRHLNVRAPEQVRRLTALLQAAARDAGLPPLLIGVDQEGGQLMAIGDGVTQLPGNMALGACGSASLARKAGEVLGRELAAMGINVDYAPSCDVNLNPANPVIGVRSFGEDPALVGDLAAAMVAGLQGAGVAATAKHFPGHGDTLSDSHDGVPVVQHTADELRRVDLPPFAAAIAAGARLVMTGHLAVPALDGHSDRPATLSPQILQGLLRAELGFQGLVISDAMDMRAIRQGDPLGEDALRAAQAGIDLLLVTADPADWRRAHAGLLVGARSGALAGPELRASFDRVMDLKRWLATSPAQPDLAVVGCAEHRAVADAIASGALTCVRDRAALLPLRLAADERLAVFLPRPQDLTPADTSSYVTPELARHLRAFHPNVDEFLIPFAPDAGEVAALVERARSYAAVVVGTINATREPGQAALVNALLATGVKTVAAALRLPYDLAAYPTAPTCVCTYSILEPSMRALAAALFGRTTFPGKLPVTIPLAN
jgi:beta-N-acetylhexosaminidase